MSRLSVGVVNGQMTVHAEGRANARVGSAEELEHFVLYQAQYITAQQMCRVEASIREPNRIYTSHFRK